MSWIEWFSAMEEHVFLSKVSLQFILDSSNIADLLKDVKHFNYPKFAPKRFNECIQLILSR